jgi:hypothetical protein
VIAGKGENSEQRFTPNNSQNNRPGSRKPPSETGGPLKTANSGGFHQREYRDDGLFESFIDRECLPFGEYLVCHRPSQGFASP